MWRKLAPILLLSIASCKYLDLGWDDKSNWELKAFWDKGPSIGEEDPANKGYDKDGNKIPSPEVLATYSFPDIHAGLAVEVTPKVKITPTMGVNLVDFKVPYLRWFEIQAQGGANMVDVYLGKRLTSIFEITVGPWFGYDFVSHGRAAGVGVTIIKF